MANAVTAGSLYKFLSHKRKVLSLYKRSLRHLEDYCAEEGRSIEKPLNFACFCLLMHNWMKRDIGSIPSQENPSLLLHIFSYERTLLRARFDRYKDEKDFTKATQLLKLGEEEWWQNQHLDPCILATEEDGVMYQRAATHQESEMVMDDWHPKDKAMFPDYFAKREKWYETRRKTWADEMKCLQEWDMQQEKANIPMTDALPAAKEKNGYPPFWWKRVTRPLEQPLLMEWFPDERDHV